MCPTPNLSTEYDTGHQKRRTEENKECEFVMKYHNLEDNIQVSVAPFVQKTLNIGQLKTVDSTAYKKGS